MFVDSSLIQSNHKLYDIFSTLVKHDLMPSEMETSNTNI